MYVRKHWYKVATASDGTLSNRSKIQERLYLGSLRIKVGRIEPGFKCSFQDGPLRVDDRIPGRVAVAAFVYSRLAKNAFEHESQPVRRPTGSCIQGIAFPFVAAVAQFIEDPAHHQEHGLGGCRRFLQPRREVDVPDFDDAHLWLYVQRAGI